MGSGAGGDPRLDRQLEALRQSGARVTAARRAVLQVLLEHRDHATAETLAAAVNARNPDVHLSTVYRALDTFERLGIVTHVHLGHGRAVYHLTDEVHHHASCEVCGAVIELPADLYADVQARLRDAFGFVADAHHFALVGRCATCVSG